MSKENAVVEEILMHLSQASPEFQKIMLSVVTELKAASNQDKPVSKERKESRMQELNRKDIGLRIREQRTFLKMSREDLAQKIGVSTTFLTDIELGTKSFSIKSLNRFSQVLKMPAGLILYGRDESENTQASVLLDLLERCPEGFEKYAEEMLLTFLQSHDTKK